MLYLGLQTWYLRALTGQFSRSRLTAAAVLVIAGAVAWTTAAVFALGVSSLVLGLLAVRVTFESRRATATRA